MTSEKDNVNEVFIHFESGIEHEKRNSEINPAVLIKFTENFEKEFKRRFQDIVEIYMLSKFYLSPYEIARAEEGTEEVAKLLSL